MHRNICGGNGDLEDRLQYGVGLDSIELCPIDLLTDRLEEPSLQKLHRRRHTKEKRERYSRAP